jgi:hypothetical protein
MSALPPKADIDSPCKLSGPFHLAIDQQDRIWITNAIGDTVTRFPVSDPSKVEGLAVGGLAIELRFARIPVGHVHDLVVAEVKRSDVPLLV